MANIGKWNAPSSVLTIFTTQLDSLASNTQSAASSAIANQTNLDVYVDIELNLGSLTPAAQPHVDLYILEAVDGTNYPSPSAADLRLQSTQLLCVIPLSTTAATAQRIVIRNLLIPPGTVKLILDNQTGTAFAASGNTLKWIAYNLNLNG